MKSASADAGMTCKNNHVILPDEGGIPKRCPVCGVRIRSVHPFLMGIGVGFLVCALVSLLELSLLSWINYSAWGPVVLFGAIPLVLVAVGSVGGAYMKARYGNFRGIGSYLTGVGAMVVLFGVLWVFFLILVSIMMCIPDC
jgi:hypothetical protein